MPYRFGRPVPPSRELPSLIAEAGRLRAFRPPFRFTSFFSPEDTLLCQCAAEAALSHARSRGPASRNGTKRTRIAELTSGSGLVGLHLLRVERNSVLLGLDVDAGAATTATENASFLGLTDRARFKCADLWSTSTTEMLLADRPHLIVCNPPYIPEPPGERLAMEAGSGADGTAHLLCALRIVRRVKPRALALSWCSLSDPARIVAEAARCGYRLNSLFVVAIADGEYSGSVHGYLRTLQTAYLNDNYDTISVAAPDGAARFVYLLMAGEFSLEETNEDAGGSAAAAVEALCSRFARIGIGALVKPSAPFAIRTSLLDRWDELRLRAFLHGPIESMATAFR